MMIPTPAADSPAPSLRQWVQYPAIAGFVVGFLGPVVLTTANLGPLLGIFVTGPGGAALGLVVGLAARAFGLSAARQWRALWSTCGVISVVALYYSLPDPAWRGILVDAEVRECKRPAQALDRAVAFREKKSLAELRNAGLPAGWQDDLRRTAEVDSGVVLEMNVVRELLVVEHQKPWNKGTLTTPGWWEPKESNRVRRYYTRYAGGECANYPVGTRSVLYSYYPPEPAGEAAREWPPTRRLPRFLDLYILVPVPEEYRHFIVIADRKFKPPVQADP